MIDYNLTNRIIKLIKRYASGVTDHGLLTGLADDDHTQYHNNTRGDARYLQLSGGTVDNLNVGSASGAATGQVKAAGSYTSGVNQLDLAATWNNATGVFRAIYANITNTASASGSRLLDLAVGGTSKFSVDVSGKVFHQAIGARVYHNANQSIANDTNTIVTFNSERFDSDGFHSTTSNTSRLTVPYTGKYLVGANIAWDVNGTGWRRMAILKNGSTNVCNANMFSAGSGTASAQVCSALVHLAANDYVEVQVRQTSGGSLNVLSSAEFSPEFWIVYMGA